MQIEATAVDEQAWTLEQLAAPVSRAQWRVWSYGAAAIVLGISQRARLGEVERRAARGLPVIARSSGGGAVLVGPWMIGVTVLLPASHPRVGPGLVESYRWFGELHVDTLRAVGVAARTVTPDEARADAGSAQGARTAVGAPVKWACFGALSPWEVVDDAGRKIVGLAQQRRLSGVALVAGTLVWQPEWSLLCNALDRASDADALQARTSNCVDARTAAPEMTGVSRVERPGKPFAGAAREALRARLSARLDASLAAALG